MDLEQQPAEFFYEQAQLALKSGNLRQALDLLKVARKKAPAEQRYREALEDLQSRLTGEQEVAAAEPPGFPRGLNQSGVMRPVSAPTSPMARTGQHEQLFEAAVKGLREDDAVHARDKARDLSRGKRLRIQLACLGVLVVAGAGFWWHERPRSLDVTPYQAILPVQAAKQRSSDMELVLEVKGDAWKQLPADQREHRARQLLEIAGRSGYRRIFVFDDHSTRLATVSDELVWIAP